MISLGSVVTYRKTYADKNPNHTAVGREGVVVDIHEFRTRPRSLSSRKSTLHRTALVAWALPNGDVYKQRLPLSAIKVAR